MADPAPFLLVYDAELPGVRRWVDWIRQRDAAGRIVAFPWQSPELRRIAPELAGLPLHRELHGLDTGTRRVWSGEAVFAQVWVRLPGWRWVNFLTKIPIIRPIIRKLRWIS